MATGLSLSPLVGNRWNGRGDRSDNVIVGWSFNHLALTDFGVTFEKCSGKTKILMSCSQSGHLGIRKINTQCETKYGAQVQ